MVTKMLSFSLKFETMNWNWLLLNSLINVNIGLYVSWVANGEVRCAVSCLWSKNYVYKDEWKWEKKLEKKEQKLWKIGNCHGKHRLASNIIIIIIIIIIIK